MMDILVSVLIGAMLGAGAGYLTAHPEKRAELSLRIRALFSKTPPTP
jgi:hypothetical protein